MFQKMASSRIYCCLILVVLLILVARFPVSAADDENRWYFRLVKPTTTFGGDLDGNRGGVYKNNKYSFVPKIEAGSGFGIVIGETNRRFAGEFSYIRTSHQSEHSEVYLIYDDINDLYVRYEYNYTNEVTDVELLNLDYKLFFLNLAGDHLKFYGQAGVSLVTLTAEGCSKYLDDNYRVIDLGDAILTGFGYDYGAGVIIKFGNRLGLEGSVIGRTIEINRVRGLGAEGKLSNKLKSSGRTYSVSLNYYF